MKITNETPRPRSFSELPDVTIVLTGTEVAAVLKGIGPLHGAAAWTVYSPLFDHVKKALNLDDGTLHNMIDSVV